MTRTTVGLVGTGNAAEMHAMAIAELDDVTVGAASSRSEASATAFGDEWDCATYTDVEEMLSSADLDQVHVCTPSGAHLEPTLTAAEYGIDVLCEKPLEITTQRVDRMIDASESAGILLGGVFQQRFNPVLRTAREAVADGRLGRLSVANAHVPWWRDDEYYRGSWKGTQALDGGGALMNQSIHGIDAVQWLAAGDPDTPGGEANPVEEVFAYTDTLAHDEDDVEVEDTAVAVLRYESGTLGQILGATSMYPGSLRRLELGGRDGTIRVREDELEIWQFREEAADDDAVRDRYGPGETSGGAADPMDVDVSNHRRNIEAFVASRQTDEPFPLDGREARKAVAIIEAIYESASDGTAVQVD